LNGIWKKRFVQRSDFTSVVSGYDLIDELPILWFQFADKSVK